MSFRFAYPWLLLGLLVLIAVYGAYLWRRREAALPYPAAGELFAMAGGGSRLLARLPLVLRIALLVTLALAAARPQLYSASRDIVSPGVDIVLVLDASGSMRALDFKLKGQNVPRLKVVQNVVSDFIERRTNDRIGLVVFGDEAYTLAPLTLDKGMLLNQVDSLQVGMAGDRTAIGTAIAVGAKRLKNMNAKEKIMILLTDGESNTGATLPLEAAQAAASLGIKIYTVGIGSNGPVPFPVNSFFGPTVEYFDVGFDEPGLRQIAATTGGHYYLASDTRQLERIYRAIDRAQPSPARVKEFFHFDELYRWFLLLAFTLFAGELLLKTSRGVAP